MLDIPGQPLLDKAGLIGGCLRLPVAVDGARLGEDLKRLPAAFWGGAGGRVGVHRAAESVFLRGFAPAQGDKPVEDRPALAHLPYMRELIERAFGAPPLRALLARLPAGGHIAPHVDIPPYFGKTVRVHVPVVTNPDCWMFCAGGLYHMKVGEAWALNNSAQHAVWNGHATEARMHLISDFVPTPALLDLLARGERGLGRRDAAIEARMLRAPEAAGPY